MTLLVNKKKNGRDSNVHNFKIRRESNKKNTDNEKETE